MEEKDTDSRIKIAFDRLAITPVIPPSFRRNKSVVSTYKLENFRTRTISVNCVDGRVCTARIVCFTSENDRRLQTSSREPIQYIGVLRTIGSYQFRKLIERIFGRCHDGAVTYTLYIRHAISQSPVTDFFTIYSKITRRQFVRLTADYIPSNKLIE